ncbi:pyruvate-ferredoxin/flavodoxin oxidoreductase [Oscillibacter sp. PC13]|uniref:pyruvate:ferredoxin (flavodoxin) oxidoreductase n=1 Tax=Oscillibacter sp. PC13 TaxID=1855299 RepID=UPI0008F31A80|nr:pyruvate:ferredoxin (flavodoxin) oxidoreductase [Oscillibacter sp. PC13]SFP30103.1 pyruvate-ferredoxin/flavodoxin oxidoreductase [Oscillibacter sp. PC13]
MSEKKIMKTMDGNEACATVAYHFTEVAGIFPITPSSPMSEKVDEWAAAGRKNMFGQPVTLVEMQSEGGASGALHGVAEAGALATTFTSSQGLLLMIPNLYIMAGHRMPAVFHVAARSVAQHANNIFGDHQDVMTCRTTGVTMMSTASVQEVMDLAAVAHLTTVKTRVPFIHFHDGFRTSHEIQKIEMIDLDQVAQLMDQDALEAYHQIAMNPEHPVQRTTVQGPDVYYQSQEANNGTYDSIPSVVEGYMQGINKITGRDYHIFNYYGAEDAERVIVIMGSACEATKEVVDYLNAKGEKVGMLQIHLFRPFDMQYFLNAMPKTVKKITAMDRSKEPGAIAGAVYLDVCACYANKENAPEVFGGRYGLASKDVTPAQIKAVFDNMKSGTPKHLFTIGIVDDVTHLSLDVKEPLITESADTVSCKFWGLGSDGTVGANKNSAKIIGDHAGMYTQAYFEYDSKKSYGITKSHLRFSKSPIRSTYLIKAADFLACHSQSYITRYDMIHEIKDGGTFLLNTSWSGEELEKNLPGDVKKYIADHNVQFYTVDANKIARDLGLGNHANLILQAAFFKLSGVMPVEDAVRYMKEAAQKTYAKKGEKVVNMNLAAVDAGINSPVKVEIPAAWSQAKDERTVDENLPNVVKNIVIPCNRQRGDDLPVSTFLEHQDGTYPLGTSKYDKRGIASSLPAWEPNKCLQCNQCTFVCPHAAIRAYLVNDEEAKAAPAGFTMVDAKGAAGLKYRLQVSTLDCTGCGSCAASCLAKDKALTMEPVDDTMYDETNWNYALSLSDKPGVFERKTLKGSQFSQPLVEFSGACAGCGETPYAKLITQLYGEKTYWVNGVGCSLAWAGAFPSLPYTVNKEGRGPAFYGTLFEDQAENGLGMVLAVKQRRNGVKMQAEALLPLVAGTELEGAINAWLETFEDLDKNDADARALVAALEKAELTGEAKELADQILLHRDQLSKKVVWLFGGDGWAYDIGYGGLDHVMASGEDINVFVVDTEVYSNTGGQSSKATPVGASAKFADGGKKTAKKDLGRLMMTYPNVYVASVAMGANPGQLMKAVTEAVNHKGPSIVIAYAPCINHGIKAGMNNVQAEMKKAVDCGLWPLYRYDPNKAEKPFSLDYKQPSVPVSEFFNGEVRYAGLKIKYPEIAEKLFAEAQKEADERYKTYVRLAKSYNED